MAKIASLEFDICFSQKSIGEYEKDKSCDQKEYSEIFKNLFDVEKYQIVSNFDEHEFSPKFTPLKNINTGDIILVNYGPYSQKYIDYYEQQCIWGKVFFIDTQNDNGFMYYDTYRKSKKMYVRTISSIEREGCSYFGDSRGYDYFISKCE